MADSNTIEVSIEDGLKFGVFANAFRIVEDAGSDCFLDFLVYSAAEQEMTVVARIRVRREFLEGILSKTEDAIETFFGDQKSPNRSKIIYRKTNEHFH